ncbi:MAG: histidinol dehydrogenase [Planctomycetota bacterium]
MPTPELPLYDLKTTEGRDAYAQRLARLKNTASSTSDAAATVASILADVRTRGEDALVELMQKFTDPDYTADYIRVDPATFAPAADALDPALRDAISAAIDNVTYYQQHIKPTDPNPIDLAGATLGLRWTPVDSVGLCVPGGSAVLFSTLIMLAVPALVAGVPADNIHIIHPPPTTDISKPTDSIRGPRPTPAPAVLATCHLLGLNNLYAIGGAQGVAALAFGTHTVPPVDLIAGPGNVFVQLAKAQVAGHTGTDNGFYGPSEIVTLADHTTHPPRVAADLLAQAEHDPGKCFLIAWQPDVISNIQTELKNQFQKLTRQDAIADALRDESCALLATDEQHAATLANQLATEHLSLAVKDPDAWLTRIRHAGEVFLHDTTPVAAGDYYAGPSHCLPTGTTARFTSGVSVYTFLKRTGTVSYSPQTGGMPKTAIQRIDTLATAESLTAHAASARIRQN